MDRVIRRFGLLDAAIPSERLKPNESDDSFSIELIFEGGLRFVVFVAIARLSG